MPEDRFATNRFLTSVSLAPDNPATRLAWLAPFCCALQNAGTAIQWCTFT